MAMENENRVQMNEYLRVPNLNLCLTLCKIYVQNFELNFKFVLILTFFMFIMNLTLGLLSFILYKTSVNGFYFSNNSVIS
jgi:hypothetical protein